MRRLAALGLLATALAAQQAGPLTGGRPRPGGKPRPAVAPPPAVYEPEAAPEAFVAEHDDPVIARAMEYAHEFRNELPDFTCKQVTTRRSSRNRGRTWSADDVVEADVVYADGRENYRNIRIDGRPVRSFDSLGGTTSTGEYGTLLWNLFHPDTAAGFEGREVEEIAGVPTRIYEIRVDSDRSHWRIGAGNQQIAAPYRGRVWIEEETGEVYRIEMEAMWFPPGFPLATSELTVDYAPVEIGLVRRMLPIRSDNLACFSRGGEECRHNETRFTDYGKFAAETTIDFETDPE